MKNYDKSHRLKQYFLESVGNWIQQNIVLYPFRALMVLTLLSVILSLVVLTIHPPSYDAQSDTWWTISLNLIHGKGYSDCNSDYFPFCGPDNQITASREPLPVFLFAFVAMLSKESFVAAFSIQIFLNIIVIWGIYFLTSITAQG